jgi:hypothetical protein
VGIEIFGASHKVTVSNPLNLKCIVILIVIIWCHFVSLKITNKQEENRGLGGKMSHNGPRLVSAPILAQ